MLHPWLQCTLAVVLKVKCNTVRPNASSNRPVYCRTLGGYILSLTVLCYYPYLISSLFVVLLPRSLLTFLIFFLLVYMNLTGIISWSIDRTAFILCSCWSVGICYDTFCFIAHNRSLGATVLNSWSTGFWTTLTFARLTTSPLLLASLPANPLILASLHSLILGTFQIYSLAALLPLRPPLKILGILTAPQMNLVGCTYALL